MPLIVNASGIISPSTPQAYPCALPYAQDPASYLNGNLPGLYFASIAPGGNGADTTADVLQSFTLPPNLLNANGKALKLTAWGVTANNSDTKTLVLAHGTTSFSVSLATSTANPWVAELFLQRISATSQYAKFEARQGTAILSIQQSTSGADTLTNSLVAKVTGQAGSANANDIICNVALLELVQ